LFYALLGLLSPAAASLLTGSLLSSSGSLAPHFLHFAVVIELNVWHSGHLLSNVLGSILLKLQHI
jgi:hypothetical protein